MKAKTTTLLGILCSFGLMHMANAVIPAPGYQYGYDPAAGFLPNDPAATQPSWNYFFGAPDYTSTAAINGSVLTIATPKEQYLIYRMGSGTPGDDLTSWNPDSAVGSTVQFTAQVTAGTNNVQSMVLYTPTTQFIFAFGISEISSIILGGVGSASYAATGGYHTYQINLNTNDTADIYVDNIFGFTAVGSGTSSGSRLEFGNGFQALDGGTVNYGYIQWTNAGVIAVPEPGSIALLGMGALGFMLLRRRMNQRADRI